MTAAALPAALPVVRALGGGGARPVPGLGTWPAGDGRQPPAGHRPAAPRNFAPRSRRRYGAELCPPAAYRSYSNQGGPPGSGCWLASKTSRVGKVFGGRWRLLVVRVP